MRGILGGILAFLFGAAAVTAAERQTLRAHVPAEVQRLQSTGRLADSTKLQLAIGLPLRNREDLTNLLAKIYDPASPEYRHYLTPEQFTRDFGPTEADYEAALAFVRANHLQVTARHPNRLLIDVNGTVTDIERAFHVTLRTYEHPSEHRMFYAPDAEPSIDLEVPILGISGLDNYSLPRPRLKSVALVAGTNALPRSGSGPQGAYMGVDFRQAYVPGTVLTGAGESVGLLQFDGYTPDDITNYEVAAGLPSVTLSNVLIDGFDGQPSGSGGEIEVSLDIEMAISMAPGLSQVILYMAPNPSPFEDILNRMATDNAARQLSCSWYNPNSGPDPVADQIFLEMAAQGQSFMSASGDSDAWTGRIPFPGETPYITQVGGTTLTTSGAGGSWVSETAWNRGSGVGTGGGISTNYPIPFWQTNVSMANNQGSVTMRNVPDVALTAEDVYVRADGKDYAVGGTSCAAPLWAGFTALVNQQAANNTNAPIGFLNPTLYQIAAGGSYLSTFHDITTGDNRSTASPNRFFAAAGYDLCTGLGTPAGQELIDALSLPPAATPPTILAQPQDQSVPTASNALFYITASGSPFLQYQWSFGTTNISGATNAFLLLQNVQPNQAGNYFVQVSNAFGVATSSNAVLTVEPPIPPVIVAQPLDQTAALGGLAFFSVMVTGTPPTFQWTFNGDAITGATNSFLALFNVQATNGGLYAVAVTNAGGWAVSSNALLQVLAPGTNCESNTNGLIGLWEAEGDARNSADGSPGQLDGGVSFVPGEIGQAFSFNGIDADVLGGPSSSFMVGRTNGVTIEAWINPADVTQSQPLVEWSSGSRNGLMLWISIPSVYGGNGPGSLVLDLDDIGEGELSTPDGLIQPNVWQHVAATYDPSNGVASVYINGTLVSQTNFGTLFAATSQSVFFGYDPASTNSIIHTFGAHDRYTGAMDEVLIYNRALSDAEIQAAYNAGNYGMCFFPTTSVSVQPTNEVVLTGNNAVFTAVANGSALLSFLWTFNGTNVLDATGATLTLTNAQPEQSGLYAVQVSNGVGSVLSSNAVLVVSNATPPVITLQPTNQTAGVSNSVTFKVISSGTAPLIYQWMFNGTNIAKATNALFTVSNVLFTSAGTYAVGITNMAGATVSSNAVLTVYPGWTPTSAPTNLGWTCVASSGDGTKLFAGNSGGNLTPGGTIYRSVDSGATWQLTSAPSTNNWNTIACSSDGSKVAAANTRAIFLSTDFGVSWTKSTATSSPSANWSDIACSSDGSKLAAVQPGLLGAGGGSIYISTNSGASWVNAGAPANNWSGIAVSADAGVIVAVSSVGPIYVSTNSGANWLLATNASGIRWSCVASAADGTKMFAAVGSTTSGNSITNRGVYVSTNSGKFWSLIASTTNFLASWSNVVCSADGRVVVASGVSPFPVGSQIYISSDSGNTWRNAGAPSKPWNSVAGSADGSRFVAVGGGGNPLFLGHGGQIYIWQTSPTIGSAISTNGLTLSWPQQWTGYSLQENSDLTTTNWSYVPITATLTNGQDQVLISPTNGQGFYRLEYH